MLRLALIDRRLSGTDPLALARRLRGDTRFAGLRLVLVAETGSEASAGAAEAGFDAVEQRPTMPRTLRATLERLSVGEARAALPPSERRACVPLAEDNPVGREPVIKMLAAAG